MDVQEIEILMVGLDNAGKTLLHYTLNIGEVNGICRTIGYNVETTEHNGTKYKIYEIGGDKSIRAIRNSYMDNKSAVIYVVDVSDCDRFEEAKSDLHDVMGKSDLSDAVLLILANKMDVVPHFDVGSLAEHLNLHSVQQKWRIHGTSAMEGRDKLYKILDILKEMQSAG